MKDLSKNPHWRLDAEKREAQRQALSERQVTLREDPVAEAKQVGAKLDSSELFLGRNEVVIHHRGADYRLRQTKYGKLVLVK